MSAALSNLGPDGLRRRQGSGHRLGAPERLPYAPPMGNTFGTAFRVTTFGESHGGGVGCVVDGCPAGLKLAEADIQGDLDRRRPGQSRLTSARREPDTVEILSGVFEGKTLGTPIAMLVRNRDARASEYRAMKDVYRPSHADFTYDAKHGFRNWQGGGRASARETIGRVAAGAIAKKLLKRAHRIEILAYVVQVHTVRATVDASKVTRRRIEATPVRCPEKRAAEAMILEVDRARRAGDSVGGILECVVRRVPPGWGEPVFEKLEARLAGAMLSIPATKGFEIGSGFRGAAMTGSEHNDPFYMEGKRVRTRTNCSGGIQGGISNGEDIVFRTAFKPTATIRKPQETVTRRGRAVTLKARGRHDPCVLPRAVPIVEAMAALVLADAMGAARPWK